MKGCLAAHFFCTAFCKYTIPEYVYIVMKIMLEFQYTIYNDIPIFRYVEVPAPKGTRPPGAPFINLD